MANDPTAFLLVAMSIAVGFVQVLFMFILHNLNGEIKALRQRVHDLYGIVLRLDAYIERERKSNVETR
jgi:hypothetical protein